MSLYHLSCRSLRSTFASRHGSVIVITVLALLILGILGVVALRSTGTFQRVTGVIRGKKKSVEVAAVGLERAKTELYRRFSKLANPPNVWPISNAQYRIMQNATPDNIYPVLTAYAQDILDLFDSSCDESNVTDGPPPAGMTLFGTSINDTPVCLDRDHKGTYNYEVNLVNAAVLAECADPVKGFDHADCNSDNQTRLVTDACLAYYNANQTWDDETTGSCNAPDNYHFGDLAGPPVLGYRLQLQSTSEDSGGRKAIIDGEIVVFVSQQDENIQLAVQSILIDGFNFMLGGNIAGQARLMMPEEHLKTNLYGYEAPATLAKHYYLGTRYAYNGHVHNLGHAFLDTVDASLFGGMRVKEVLSNIGITDDLATIADAAYPFATPDDKGNYEAVFGSGVGLPVVVGAGGEFDEVDLTNKLATYNATLGTTGQLDCTAGGNPILISTNVQDNFNATNVITSNLTADAREDRSVVITGGDPDIGTAATNCTISGLVYVDGDLHTAGDLNISGQGDLIVRGNTYIHGNITVNNKPANAEREMADITASPPFNYAAALPTGDRFGLLSMKNVVVGNITNAHVASFFSTVVSASQTHTYLPVTPLDGLGPNAATDYGHDFQALEKRSDPSLYGPNYKNTLQIGHSSAANTATFPPVPIKSPPYDLIPEDTNAPGLWPENAGHSLGPAVVVPMLARRYKFNWFRDPGVDPNELPAFGFVRHRNDFDIQIPGGPVETPGFGRDGYGRTATTVACLMSAEQCTAQQQHNGGFLLNEPNWGTMPASMAGVNSYISPQGFHNLFFDKTPNNSSGNCPGFPFTTNNCAPPIQANTYDTTTGFPLQTATGDPDLSDGANHLSYLSKTSIIEARVAAAGVITGWGGRMQPRFWQPDAEPKPNLGDPATPFLDRNDMDLAAGCPFDGGGNPMGPGYYDCDGNGITFRDGAHGNIVMMSQGGIYVYHNNLNYPVSPEQRRVQFSKFEVR